MDLFEQAWMAREWVAGRTQKSIGKEIGISNAQVCMAIREFCKAAGHAVDWPHYVHYDGGSLDHRPQAKDALDRYIGPFVRPLPNTGLAEYHQARIEHSKFLRDEGLTLREIGLRQGCSAQSVRVHLFRLERQADQPE